MRHRALLLLITVTISIAFQACTFRDESLPADSSFITDESVTETGTWINLQSIKNARQLGGYHTQGNRVVKPNVILRTGELASLSDADSDLLVNDYKLAHIIDLRDEVEAGDAPDPAIKDVQYHHFIVWPREVRTRLIQESTVNRGFDSELYIRNYYTAFALDPAAIEAYRKMFEVLLDNDAGCVLIHCVHGKDRTGVASALILSALDVEWDIIEQEYLLSNITYESGVDISYLRHYKSVINENYGSIDQYLEAEMNLDNDNLMILREKYTIAKT